MSGNPWDTSSSRGSIPTTSADLPASIRRLITPLTGPLNATILTVLLQLGWPPTLYAFDCTTTKIRPQWSLWIWVRISQAEVVSQAVADWYPRAINSFPYQATSSGSGSFAAPAFSPREPFPSNYPGSFAAPSRPGSVWTNEYSASSGSYPGSAGVMYNQWGSDKERRSSPETYLWEDDYSTWTGSDFHTEGRESRMLPNDPRGKGKGYNQRKPSNRDEFDGPHQLLDKPSPRSIAAQEKDLPHLATNLFVDEQDNILTQVNDRLSKCAYDFVAKYQFPIPLESDKRPVKTPNDREWTEWVFLLKRLATKRRIPARVLYNGQIKQLITVLENSMEMRHAAKHQSRPLKDDRNVLQLISAGIQIVKTVMLSNLYL